MSRKNRVAAIGSAVAPLVLVTVLVTALVAGCAGLEATDGGLASGQRDGGGQDERTETDRARQQGRDALARLEQAAAGADGQRRFVPVADLTRQVGNWEVGVGDNNKRALMAGLVTAAAPLPAGTHPNNRVAWADGTTRAVRTVGAEPALRQLSTAAAGAGTCPECSPLRVTGARAVTTDILTSHGPATVPAWEYQLADTRVRLVRAAVDPADTVSVTPPAWDPNKPPAGLPAIESAAVTGTGTDLEAIFTGSPEPGNQPCGVDYTAEAVESEHAVVVFVISHPYPGNGQEIACNDLGARRTATVRLTRPLGDRAVLDVAQGLPVPVTGRR